MSTYKFVIEAGLAYGPLERDIDWFSVLTDVAEERIEFAILTEEGSGWFVQAAAAGSDGTLVVEYQVRSSEGRLRHYRLCRPGLGDPGLKRRRSWWLGRKGYMEKERFDVLHAIEVFKSFVRSLNVPSTYELNDIAAELGLES